MIYHNCMNIYLPLNHKVNIPYTLITYIYIYISMQIGIPMRTYNDSPSYMEVS